MSKAEHGQSNPVCARDRVGRSVRERAQARACSATHSVSSASTTLSPSRGIHDPGLPCPIFPNLRVRACPFKHIHPHSTTYVAPPALSPFF
eukprot:133422-Pleurochrysis_carterae.AAC.1